MKISLCMIVKDEEEVLGRCLGSASGCFDEIIVVDTGSADDTKTIAREYTDKLYDYAWHDDFAAARNFAFSKADGDYLVWLDADDFLPKETVERTARLRELLERELPDVVMCPYDTAFDDDGKPLSTCYRERFLKRSTGFSWQGRVHECIAPRGQIVRFPFRVVHLGSEKERGRRNLHIYQKWAEEEPLGARDKFYYGRELYYHRLYCEAIAVLREMLAGEGWNVNKIEACKVLAACHKERGETEEAKSALLNSFRFGEPRASVCCELAKLFKTENRLGEAVYWYEAALICRDHSVEGDFEEPHCRGITPLLELTCCYYALGDVKKSLRCHRKAEQLAPNHPAVLFNRDFFRQLSLD